MPIRQSQPEVCVLVIVDLVIGIPPHQDGLNSCRDVGKVRLLNVIASLP
jgi:hypothetical protein